MNTYRREVIHEHEYHHRSGSEMVEYLVYFLFSILEILLAFRFFLKLAGANSFNAFVSFIYNVSGPFVAPFEGIFHRAIIASTQMISVFEPATLLALVVYSIVVWAIIWLIHILSGHEPMDYE